MQTFHRIFLAISMAILVVALTSCESETNAPQGPPATPQADLAIQMLDYEYVGGHPSSLSIFFPAGIPVDTAVFAASHNGDSHDPIVSFEYRFDADPATTVNPAPYTDLPILISIGANINEMFCRDTIFWDDTPGEGPAHMSPELLQTTIEMTIRLKSNGATATLSYPSLLEDANYKITGIWVNTRNDAWISGTQHEFYPTVYFEANIFFIDKRMTAGENAFHVYTRCTVSPR